MQLHKYRRLRHRQYRLGRGILPQGIKLVAWMRTIRWIGWGFGEALIPIFIFSFSATFAEAGLLRSIYEIASIFALPLIGMSADRLPAKYLIVSALAIYPLIGVSYFFAGLFGMAVFIVVARGLNGILWEMENVGVATYYRRTAERESIGSSFGYIDTVSHVGWIFAALIGMGFAASVPIHYLLLAIAPTSLIALVVALRIPKDTVRTVPIRDKFSFLHSYGRALTEWRTWSGRLWLAGVLVVFSSLIEALIWFFIPIDAYVDGAKLSMVVLLAVTATVPYLFGYLLGKIADRHNPYGLAAGGLGAIAVVMVLLAIFPQYTAKLVAAFILGVLLELFAIIEESLVTKLGPAETYGERGSAFEVIATLGDLAMPLIIGIAWDILGFGSVSSVIACIAAVLAVCYLRVKGGNPGSL